MSTHKSRSTPKRTDGYIDGEWDRLPERDRIPVSDPTTRSQIGTVPAGTEPDVERAFDAATAAQERWEETLPSDRADAVYRVIDALQDEREAVEQLLVEEAGSTITKAAVEVDLAINHLEFAATLPTTKSGEQSRSATIPGKVNRVHRTPVGVVGVITPWNYPLALAARAVGAAIALGNAVVLKPAEDTPIVGGAVLADLCDRAGIPDGVFNVVPGYGPEAGEAIASHPDAAVVSFTGSTAVGRHVGTIVTEQLAEPALELGGNNPYLVLSDADLSRAVDAGVFGSFMHQGQACISINRHLVHESIYDEYIDRFVDRVRALPVGDPHDSEAVIGPVINDEQREEIMTGIERTIEAGATLETGGDHDGLFIKPTVLSDVTNGMQAAREEQFGPVAPIIPFESDREAIALANDTEYGLSAAIQSTNLERAEAVAEQLESGMVHINDQPFNGDPTVPFGGVKDSGVGRYNGDAIYRKLTESKWVSVQREPREYPF